MSVINKIDTLDPTKVFNTMPEFFKDKINNGNLKKINQIFVEQFNKYIDAKKRAEYGILIENMFGENLALFATNYGIDRYVYPVSDVVFQKLLKSRVSIASSNGSDNAIIRALSQIFKLDAYLFRIDIIAKTTINIIYPAQLDEEQVRTIVLFCKASGTQFALTKNSYVNDFKYTELELKTYLEIEELRYRRPGTPVPPIGG